MIAKRSTLVTTFLVSFSLVTAAVLPVHADVNGKIVGGIEAGPGAWPFQAAIMDASQSQFCGGSLIGRSWVMSAAHCFVDENTGDETDAASVLVGLGYHRLSAGGELHNVSRIIVHPSYNPTTSDNDIALLELTTPATQAPVVLNFSASDLTGQTATVIGWGLTIPGNDNSSPDELRQVDVPVVANATCNTAYNGGITANMVCAGFAEGGKDSCQGDSGGPLVISNGATVRQIGVVSFGQDCAAPGMYGVYTRVSQYESFIKTYVPIQALAAADGKYGLWNSFLNQTNIIELINRSGSAVTAQVNMYAIDGTQQSTNYFTVGAGAQQDVIINSLAGFRPDSYGIIQVSSNIDGRIMYYRPTGGGFTNFEFVFGLPLSSAITGTTAVGFNTFQPSFNPADQGNLVANWLSIVNLESSAKSFTIKKYDNAGTLLSQSSQTVAAKSRVDVDGGHVVPGPANVGLIEIIPADGTAGYLAQIMRYGYGANNTLDFAFPLVAKAGSSALNGVSLGSSFLAQNWLEIINGSGSTNTVTVSFYNASGSVLSTQQLTLAGHAQSHLNVNAVLGDQQRGLATVTSQSGLPVLSESMFYFRGADGIITSMYGSQSGVPVSSRSTGSFNLFLGMQNYLKISNPNNSTANVDVTVSSAFSSGSSRTITLPAFGSTELSLHDTADFGTVADSYGTVVVEPSSVSTPLIEEVLRLKLETSGDVQFTAPTGLQ